MYFTVYMLSLWSECKTHVKFVEDLVAKDL